MASCSKSNGKVEYRKTETGCLEIPDMLFRDPNLKDTTMRMDGILDEYTLKLLAENSKAKFLYEKRKQVESESEAAYLINTSSSNIISFTIKSISNDIVKTSSTQVYKTNPGEEVLIGCNSYINNKYEIIKQEFEIVGERKITLAVVGVQKGFVSEVHQQKH